MFPVHCFSEGAAGLHLVWIVVLLNLPPPVLTNSKCCTVQDCQKRLLLIKDQYVFSIDLREGFSPLSRVDLSWWETATSEHFAAFWLWKTLQLQVKIAFSFFIYLLSFGKIQTFSIWIIINSWQPSCKPTSHEFLYDYNILQMTLSCSIHYSWLQPCTLNFDFIIVNRTHHCIFCFAFKKLKDDSHSKMRIELWIYLSILFFLC